MMSKDFTKAVKSPQKIMLDSYDTLGSLWQMAYELVGDYEHIKIVMDDNGFEVINTLNNTTVLYGDIV